MFEHVDPAVSGALTTLLLAVIGLLQTVVALHSQKIAREAAAIRKEQATSEQQQQLSAKLDDVVTVARHRAGKLRTRSTDAAHAAEEQESQP